MIAIVDNYKQPLDRLLHIILKFLSQSEPPPTWRAIVNALRSKTVNLTALAKRVEAAHFPDPTASRDPPTTSGESANTPNPCLRSCHILQCLHHYPHQLLHLERDQTTVAVMLLLSHLLFHLPTLNQIHYIFLVSSHCSGNKQQCIVSSI